MVKDDMIQKLKQEAEFFKKQAEYSYKRSQHVENAPSSHQNSQASPDILQN